MYRILQADENPTLRERAHDIAPGDITSARIKRLIASMKELLAEEKYGVALAAPQVGEPLRLFIVSGAALAREAKRRGEEEGTESIPDQVYINPELVKVSRMKRKKHEGCLSIRGKWGVVPRAEKATVRALDEEGSLFMRGASGFLAHIFQHEMDHLDGVLYIDKADDIYDDEPEE